METESFSALRERAKKYGRAAVPCLFAVIGGFLGVKGYLDVKEGFSSNVGVINGANAQVLLHAPQADIDGAKHELSLDLVEFGAVEAAAVLLAAKSVIEGRKLLLSSQPAQTP